MTQTMLSCFHLRRPVAPSPFLLSRMEIDVADSHHGERTSVIGAPSLGRGPANPQTADEALDRAALCPPPAADRPGWNVSGEYVIVVGRGELAAPPEGGDVRAEAWVRSADNLDRLRPPHASAVAALPLHGNYQRTGWRWECGSIRARPECAGYGDMKSSNACRTSRFCPLRQWRLPACRG